jgi:hypothetical protein
MEEETPKNQLMNYDKEGNAFIYYPGDLEDFYSQVPERVAKAKRLGWQDFGDTETSQTRLQKMASLPKETKIPIQLNNPLNIKIDPRSPEGHYGVASRYAMKLEGGEPYMDENKHLIFDSPDSGLRGAVADYSAKMKENKDISIIDYAKEHAKDYKTWTKNTIDTLGVSQDTKVGTINPMDFIEAVSQTEGFSNKEKNPVFRDKQHFEDINTKVQEDFRQQSVDDLYAEFEKIKLGDKKSTEKLDVNAKQLEEKTLEMYPLTTEARNLLNKRIIPKTTTSEDYASAEKIGENTEVSINKEQKEPTSMFHEFFHTFFNHDKFFGANAKAFQSQFDIVKASDPRLQLIDEILEKDKKNYGKFPPKWIMEERFAWVGELFGQGGLSSFPAELQPFYKRYLNTTI